MILLLSLLSLRRARARCLARKIYDRRKVYKKKGPRTDGGDASKRSLEPTGRVIPPDRTRVRLFSVKQKNVNNKKMIFLGVLCAPKEKKGSVQLDERAFSLITYTYRARGLLYILCSYFRSSDDPRRKKIGYET